MRILLVAHQLPPRHVGGVEVYTWTMAKELAAQGHDVTIFAPTADRSQEGEHLDGRVRLVRPYRRHPQSENVIAAFWHSFRHRRIERVFGRALTDMQPDVVHVMHPQWVSARLLRICGERPLVLSLHDYWFLCPNGQLLAHDQSLCDPTGDRSCERCAIPRIGAPPWVERILLALLRPILRARNRYVMQSALEADHFLTPSAFVRDMHVAAGLPSSKIESFALGTEPSRLAHQDAWRPPEDLMPPVFCYLGSVAWQKGVHTLVEAFVALDSPASLVIYGALDTFPDYVAHLRALAGDDPRIQFAGPVPPEAVGDALRLADCIVVPSIWYEAFGMVAQEAHDMGIPVIASRIGGLSRIRDGVDGFLFDPGDVVALRALMARLAQEPEMLAMLANGARPGPKLHKQAARLASLYEELLARRA